MSEAEGLDRGEPLFASHENHLRYPIDAFFPIDLESGLLNRNGLVESIRRCMLWWDRRREQFEVLAVYLPWVEEVAPAERPALVRQLAATMSAKDRGPVTFLVRVISRSCPTHRILSRDVRAMTCVAGTHGWN